MRHSDSSEILPAFATYLTRVRGFAAGTRKAYVAAARELLELVQARPEALLLAPDAGLEAVDRRALEIHLNHLRDARAWRPATLSARLRALRALFGWLLSAGRISSDPTRGMRIEGERNETAMPAGDVARVRRLFQAAGAGLAGARLGLLLELIYCGGLRPFQAYHLRALRCDAARAAAFARIESGEMELTLSAEGIARAEAYLARRAEVLLTASGAPGAQPLAAPGTDAGEAPFWIGGRGRAIGAATLSRQVRAAMERAGLQGGAADLRRLAALHFRERGADLRSLQRFLGARRLSGMERYSAAEYRGVAEQLRRLHPRRDPQ